MVKSMTGYGRGESTGNGKIWSVEMKTVNHRFLDINIKLPRQYSLLEEKIRSVVKKQAARGRIDIYIKVEEENESSRKVKLDKILAKEYYNNLRELAETLHINFAPTVIEIASLPEVMDVEQPEEDLDQIWPSLEEAIIAALNSVMQMRESEGKELAKDLHGRLNTIKQLVEKIEDRNPQFVEEYKAKLQERVSELAGEIDIDEDRLAAEVVIMADRSNITEEIVRLYSHLKQFSDNLQKEGTIGRKLDFLVQEMHREVNTIGSKSSDTEISNLVVNIKSELEKIKEQVQNIE
ncbi:MAG: hypothetical protein PWQ96_1617 [Clostridia bacterium]|jgi:uncharacterized protein (TIGR00255 family)|nr:hypothetical protein [Clostridiales bacterium]MDK2985974.1 hypothetical protein [Clostridia bacterium]